MKTLLLLMPLTAIALTGCDRPRNDTDTGGQAMNLADVLGDDDTAGYQRAVDPRSFRFPRDHAAHNDFRNEWWYFTGNLEANDGHRYGYQLTFFRNALAPPDPTVSNPSAWTSRQVWMAHAAVTDIDGRRHTAVERFSRAEPGLAGAQLDPLRIWLHNWRISSAANDFPWRLEIDDDAFSLQLTLEAEKAPVLHGENGLSRKGDKPGEASHYYSITRLKTRGQIRLGDRTVPVEGSSWLDREWSTGALGESVSGWDWFSVQFNDGTEWMYYRLRDRDGEPHPNSGGSHVDGAGNRQSVQPEQVELTPLEHWRSESGRRYPVRWRVRDSQFDRSWIIAATADNQLMNLAFEYWEGAVEVRDSRTGDVEGRGYLEMVRGDLANR